MFYGLNKLIKNLLPKTLFYRALLIVAAPIIILQITISIVFFDSLWIKTNKGMTRALVGEIKTYIEAFDHEKYNKDPLIFVYCNQLHFCKLQQMCRFHLLEILSFLCWFLSKGYQKKLQK